MYVFPFLVGDLYVLWFYTTQRGCLTWKFDFDVRKGPPFLCFLRPMSPVHVFPPMSVLEIYISVYAWVFKVVSFLHLCQSKPCMHFFCLPDVPYTPPNSVLRMHNIWWCDYAILSSLLLHHHVRPKYPPRRPILGHPQPLTDHVLLQNKTAGNIIFL